MELSIVRAKLTASVKEGGDLSLLTPKTRSLALLPFRLSLDDFTEPEAFETRLSVSFD